MRKSLFITLVLVLLTTSIYAKRKKPALGILQFEIKTEKVTKISKHMYDYLQEEVSRLVSDKYRIVPAPKMDLEEMYMMFACDSPDLTCMVSIAKMMKVKYLVYGTVSAQRGKYELVLKLLNVRTKKVKKGRLLGDFFSKEAMNKNIDAALRAMFDIKEKNVEVRLLSVVTNGLVSDVYIDDKKIGTTPLILTSKSIKPGAYSLLIKKEGYEPVKREIILSKNKIETIDLKLSAVVIPALKDKDVATKDTIGDENLDLTKNTKPIKEQNEWYQEWWVWGVAGGVIAATVVTIVLLSGDDAESAPSHNVVISF